MAGKEQRYNFQSEYRCSQTDASTNNLLTKMPSNGQLPTESQKRLLVFIQSAKEFEQVSDIETHQSQPKQEIGSQPLMINNSHKSSLQVSPTSIQNMILRKSLNVMNQQQQLELSAKYGSEFPQGISRVSSAPNIEETTNPYTGALDKLSQRIQSVEDLKAGSISHQFKIKKRKIASGHHKAQSYFVQPSSEYRDELQKKSEFDLYFNQQSLAYQSTNAQGRPQSQSKSSVQMFKQRKGSQATSSSIFEASEELRSNKSGKQSFGKRKQQSKLKHSIESHFQRQDEVVTNRIQARNESNSINTNPKIPINQAQASKVRIFKKEASELNSLISSIKRKDLKQMNLINSSTREEKKSSLVKHYINLEKSIVEQSVNMRINLLENLKREAFSSGEPSRPQSRYSREVAAKEVITNAYFERIQEAHSMNYNSQSNQQIVPLRSSSQIKLIGIEEEIDSDEKDQPYMKSFSQLKSRLEEKKSQDEGYQQVITNGDSIKSMRSVSQLKAGSKGYAQLTSALKQKRLSDKRVSKDSSMDIKSIYVLAYHLPCQIGRLQLPQMVE